MSPCAANKVEGGGSQTENGAILPFPLREAENGPRDFVVSSAEKMLRVRSHFHENSSLILRRERHKTSEVLQSSGLK